MCETRNRVLWTVSATPSLLTVSLPSLTQRGNLENVIKKNLGNRGWRVRVEEARVRSDEIVLHPRPLFWHTVVSWSIFIPWLDLLTTQFTLTNNEHFHLHPTLFGAWTMNNNNNDDNSYSNGNDNSSYKNNNKNNNNSKNDNVSSSKSDVLLEEGNVKNSIIVLLFQWRNTPSNIFLTLVCHKTPKKSNTISWPETRSFYPLNSFIFRFSTIYLR